MGRRWKFQNAKHGDSLAGISEEEEYSNTSCQDQDSSGSSSSESKNLDRRPARRPRQDDMDGIDHSSRPSCCPRRYDGAPPGTGLKRPFSNCTCRPDYGLCGKQLFWSFLFFISLEECSSLSCFFRSYRHVPARLWMAHSVDVTSWAFSSVRPALGSLKTRLMWRRLLSLVCLATCARN